MTTAPMSILTFLEPRGAKRSTLKKKPRKMASPPIRGVGAAWRCRALAVPAFPGMSMAPTFSASFLASGVVSSEIAKATSRATAAATGAE